MWMFTIREGIQVTEKVEWYHWTNAVHTSEDERNRFIQEIVSHLRADPKADYNYIATGNVVVLGFREKNSIHIKVMQPVRTADFPLEPSDDDEPHNAVSGDVYDSQSADHR